MGKRKNRRKRGYNTIEGASQTDLTEIGAELFRGQNDYLESVLSKIREKNGLKDAFEEACKRKDLPDDCVVDTFVLQKKMRLDEKVLGVLLFSSCEDMTARWIWEKHKVVYKIDADLAKKLYDQARQMERARSFPTERISHFPYPAIYIAAPGLTKGVEGVYCWLSYSREEHVKCLHTSCPGKDFGNFAYVLPLIPGKSVRHCVRYFLEKRMLDDLDVEIPSEAEELLTRVAQIIMYIMDASSDVMEVRTDSHPRLHYEGTDVSGTRTYEVSYRNSYTINQNRHYQAERRMKRTVSGKQSSHRISHPRKAHWHKYWVGHGDNKHLIKRWVHAIMVCGGDNPIPTIHTVG